MAATAANLIVVVASFTPVVREEYRLGVPEPGYYREIFNSDAGLYGGGNVGNAGGLYAEPIPVDGQALLRTETAPPAAGRNLLQTSTRLAQRGLQQPAIKTETARSATAASRLTSVKCLISA